MAERSSGGNASDLLDCVRDEAKRRGIKVYKHCPGAAESSRRLVVAPRMHGLEFEFFLGVRSVEARFVAYLDPSKLAQAISMLTRRRSEIDSALGGRPVWVERTWLHIKISMGPLARAADRGQDQLAADLVDALMVLRQVLDPIIAEIAAALDLHELSDGSGRLGHPAWTPECRH